MIISIMDVENQLSDAAAITALVAGISAIAKSKKTLVLQYTDSGTASILNILSGKEIRENEIRDVYSYDDAGLDALLIRAETSDLTKEHYDECVTKLLEKENMFDVIRPTSKPDLHELADNDALKNIIVNARSIYDYVFVMIPADKEQRRKLVTGLTDEDIIIVPQGKEVGAVDVSNGKTNLLVRDYEPDSRFDLGFMRKKYGIKRIYTVPHNVGFRDGVIMENVLDFILKNRKDIKGDDNYPLTSSLNELMGRYVSDDTEDDDEAMFINTDQRSHLHKEQATILPETAVQEVNVRRGLFGRKKGMQIMIDLPTDKER